MYQDGEVMLKAIQTEYQNCKFRSRLEARWAVFFDTLGIEWEYEKEGFDLGEAGKYLPDFWLPKLDCWVEIKPSAPPSPDEFTKCKALAEQSGKFVFMLFSDLCPNHIEYFGEQVENEPRDSIRIVGSNRYFCPCGDSDGGMCWGECQECGSIHLGHFGSHAISYDKCDEKFECPGKCNDESPRILAAYKKAKQARFEHGESPQ